MFRVSCGQITDDAVDGGSHPTSKRRKYDNCQYTKEYVVFLRVCFNAALHTHFSREECERRSRAKACAISGADVLSGAPPSAAAGQPLFGRARVSPAYDKVCALRLLSLSSRGHSPCIWWSMQKKKHPLPAYTFYNMGSAASRHPLIAVAQSLKAADPRSDAKLHSSHSSD